MRIHTNAIVAGIVVATVLSAIQIMLDKPMLLAARFFPAWGAYIQIATMTAYAIWLSHKMTTATNTSIWRKRSWTFFSIIFFAQFALGLLGFDKFLMTGTLHLPIPALIIGGAVYKLKIGFMPILYLSTIILSGPAWCSHLCYFGALDMQAAGSKQARPIANKTALKNSFLAITILGALLLRMFDLPYLPTVIIASSLGLVGLLLILFVSRRYGQMFHCTAYCPVGTITQYLKFLNPFRMYIEPSACTLCMQCTPTCRYDALSPADIQGGKPGLSCTYCGDCVSACHSTAIRYRIFGIHGQPAQRIWISLTVSLHVIFLALARL